MSSCALRLLCCLQSETAALAIAAGLMAVEDERDASKYGVEAEMDDIFNGSGNNNKSEKSTLTSSKSVRRGKTALL